MKAKPKTIRALVLAAKAEGKSFEVVAAEFDVPLGTVKTWWARYRHETFAAVEKKGGDETYRGLKACHMPGSRKGSKAMTFALFKRNLWPPAVWKVPPGLVGGELLMMLQERSCMGLAAKGRKTGGEKD
jgi:hypothetical protein